jgi:hypothetical protein
MKSNFYTVNAKVVVKGRDEAKFITDHLDKYINDLLISYCSEVTFEKSINRDAAVAEKISSTFESKLPVGTEVKVNKKGLKIIPLIRTIQIEPGTKGKITEIDEGTVLAFSVKFESGKTVYCSFYELEEV